MRQIAGVDHHDLMFGIPIYSDLADVHDYVVQSHGAFDETVRGILNLKSADVQVEIRVVIHKQTFDRLPQLARFIARNLTFVDQVVFMGLEITGFTRANLDLLWIDPVEYQEQLVEAVQCLADHILMFRSTIISFAQPIDAYGAMRVSLSATGKTSTCPNAKAVLCSRNVRDSFRRHTFATVSTLRPFLEELS